MLSSMPVHRRDQQPLVGLFDEYFLWKEKLKIDLRRNLVLIALDINLKLVQRIGLLLRFFVAVAHSFQKLD